MVAHIIQNLNYGGMERVLHNLGRELPRRGFEVHIVVLEYLGRFAEGLTDGVTLHKVPPMSKLSLFHPRALVRLLRTIAPDIVHSHTGVWMKAARAAGLAGVPAMVHTEHGRPVPDHFTDRAIDGFASRRTDATIAVSEALAQILRQDIVHDPSRVRLITNGVQIRQPASATDRAALRMTLGIPPIASVIGTVGRLEPVKNYSLALRAFACLRANLDRAVQPFLVIVGDGSERPELESLAETLRIADRVKFLGWREDAEHLYGAFDLFTLTSRSEGTSISLLEAMSVAVCPVVTDVGGNRAVLGPALSSLVVPSDDPAALAVAWRDLLQHAEIRRTFAELARDRVLSHFSLDTMVDEHALLYRELARATSAGNVASPRVLPEGHA